MSDNETGVNGEVASGDRVMEELLTRQRREKKELLARFTSMKHSIAKSDKKRKKEIAGEMAELEREMGERHEEERRRLTGENGEATTDNRDVDDVPEKGEDVQDAMVDKPRRPTKDKKTLEARVVAEAALDDETSVESVASKQEEELLGKELATRGLLAYEIHPDGDCLYNSLAHQASLHSHTQFTGEDLRRRAAAYLRAHRDDFLPFLTTENGDEIRDEMFDDYCEQVEKPAKDGGAWGGEPELRALSCSLERRIEVLMPGCDAVVMGEDFATSTPLVVTFHRLKYRLGEHYDSTIPAALVAEKEN